MSDWFTKTYSITPKIIRHDLKQQQQQNKENNSQKNLVSQNVKRVILL